MAYYDCAYYNSLLTDVANGEVKDREDFKSMCKLFPQLPRDSLSTIIFTPHIDILSYILEEGADVDSHHLVKAASCSNMDALHMLMDRLQRETPEDRNAVLTYALRLVAMSQYPDMWFVEFLLENGADAREKNVVWNAIENGNLKLVEYLQDRGVELTAGDFDVACFNEQYKVALWLYKQGIFSDDLSEEFLEYKAENERVLVRRSC